MCAPEAPRRLPGAVAGSGAGRAPLPPDSGLTGACLRRLSCPPRSTWTATCWPCPTTCLCTTTPSTGGGPAAWTRQKVRPLLIWKMVGTRYVSSFYLRCFLFFAPSFLSLFCVRPMSSGRPPPLPSLAGGVGGLSFPILLTPVALALLVGLCLSFLLLRAFPAVLIYVGFFFLASCKPPSGSSLRLWAPAGGAHILVPWASGTSWPSMEREPVCVCVCVSVSTHGGVSGGNEKKTNTHSIKCVPNASK